MCEICHHVPCISGCPNYIPPKTDFHCSICGEGIYIGDEYVENDYGAYAHFDCFTDTKQLINWLGYRVSTLNTEKI